MAPVNDAPVMSVPDNIQITEDKNTYITIEVTDIENDSLSLDITGWTHGLINTDQLPVITFYPEKDYFGVDTLVFQLSDGKSSVTQSVQLWTLAVNDAPVARSQSISTMEDMPVAITLQATDIDSDSLNYQITQTQHGTIIGNPQVVLYTPDHDWFGMDQLVFTVNDGELISNEAVIDIQVKAVNDPPTIEITPFDLNEDTILTGKLKASDPDNDPLVFLITQQSLHGNVIIVNENTGEFQYVPQNDYSGTDEFWIKVTDGTLESQAQVVHLGITPVNDAPVLSDSQFSTFEDHSFTYTLAALDLESDSLSYSLVQQAVKGKVSLNEKTGILIYTPFPDVNGMDAFNVIADDGMMQSAIAC